MEKRFLYRSSAVALGGRITRPFCEVIESQAATVLPIAGGHGNARVDGFRYRDLVSFRTAYSTVSGNPSGTEAKPIYNSLATVTIEGLNVMNVVTADAVVARLVSQHEDEDELPLHPVGSYFVNLRIAGVRVDLRPHDGLFACRTLADVAKACGKGGPVALDGTPLKVDPASSKSVLTSLFDRPALPSGCATKDGWGIHLPGFGDIYLGEYLLGRSTRRLTMLRIEMGSPVRGFLAFADTEGNGSTYP